MTTELVAKQGTHIVMLTSQQIRDIGLSEQEYYFSKESFFLKEVSFANKEEWPKQPQVR